jgi:hypothetical protein
VKNIYRKSAHLSVLVLVLFVVASCEENFTDIESGVIRNTKFSTGEVVLDLEINTINLASIVADNILSDVADNSGLPKLINGTRPPMDYWLGVYENANAKNLKASFVSQIVLAANLKNSEDVMDGDTIYNLDKVVLKIPYTAFATGVDSNGLTTYKLDSILGSTSVTTTLEVYRNPTYLNLLNRSNRAKDNTFLSDFDYKEIALLTETTGFSFTPQATDSIFTFDRIDRTVDANNTTTVQDTLRVRNSQNIQIPFLAIPLDLSQMKTLFWDEFNGDNFSSSDKFQTYFRGIILRAKGTDGALVPFNLASLQTSVDFLYSKTVLKEGEANEVIKDTYSFALGGIQNSIYEMGEAPSVPENSFVVQGTAGISAGINILGVNLSNLLPDDPFLEYADKDADSNNYLSLEELATIKDEATNEFVFLINDADLTFAVNSGLSTDSYVLPQRLHVYQNKANGNGGLSPTHLSDSYEETTFSGVLYTTDTASEAQGYTFKITDYISDLMDGSSTDFSPLVLKVYNITDNPTITGFLNRNVLQYNWNPRAVVLFNENADNRAQLKISYTKKNN